MVTCFNTNPPLVSNLTVLDPNGEVVSVSLGGVFTVPNAARNYSGTYTCLINSTVNNDTSVVATAEVTIQCELSCHNIAVMEIMHLIPYIAMFILTSP